MLTSRVDAYILQSNRKQFTPAQIRRMRKKMNHGARKRHGRPANFRVNAGWFMGLSMIQPRREMLLFSGHSAAHFVKGS